MDLSLVRRKSEPGAELGRQTVGNALVVHPLTGMTGEAQALALGVAADSEHDLVVVDLPVGSPISLWESVAKALPRRRRGVRLVIGGRSRETSALAGQWLAERIGRTVVAPDGSVIPSAGGALFVHSGRGSGWVRFQPGRPPKWEAKRFPRPSWDSGLTAELTSTSSRGVAEPLPGGLWVRPVGFDREQGRHRTALIRGLPAQHDTMTIVLGCPGGPPLTLDDAARLWVRLPEQVRQNARFVQYGPMSVPAGTTLGQALADLLGKQVAFYTGLPVGGALDVRTVLFDGRLGWASFARELAYVPRAGDEAPLPTLLAHRPPIGGLAEVSPAVYWYSPDAVLEVVQSGLLLRPPRGGDNAEALRAITLDESLHNLTFDTPEGDSDERMRTLAEDVLARLDEHTRRVSRILPAAALLAERARVTISTKALAEIEAGHPQPRALEEAAPTEVVRPAAAVDLGVDAAEVPARSIFERLDPAGGAARALTAAAPIVITTALPPLTVPVNAEEPAEESVKATFTETKSLNVAFTDNPPPVPPPAVPPAGMPPVAAAPVIAEAPLVAEALVVADVAPPAPVAPPATPAPEPKPELAPVEKSVKATLTDSKSLNVAFTDNAPAESTVDEPAPDEAAAPQPTPTAEASALLPKRGVDTEREWLRKSLGAEYGLMSNAVARILSEHPGFQGALSTSSADVLTDAVAVQLHLSEKGVAIDTALRSGRNGPHVPIARCVVAGLSRLPSHRGPATFAAKPSKIQWELYRSRKVLTEWGFLHTLTQPVPGGDTDVLVWSVTARRTRLLEPVEGGVDNRVLFVPGTSFKVLELTEPEAGKRGLVLLRELTVSEVDETGTVASDRISLDELALVSLRRELEVWAEGDERRPVGDKAAGRFGALPGLV